MAIAAPKPHQRGLSTSSIRLSLLLLTSFLFGLAMCSAFFLWHAHRNDPLLSSAHSSPLGGGGVRGALPPPLSVRRRNDEHLVSSSPLTSSVSSSSILDGLRVLVTIASYDFMQLPHLEEVLDGFQDLCYAGSKVDIVVYTTVVVRRIVRVSLWL